MATLCKHPNLLPKPKIAKKILSKNTAILHNINYDFLLEYYANRNNNLLLPPNSLNQKTMVLDLDETLVHSTFFYDTSIPITPPEDYDFLLLFGEVAYVKKRPFVDEFLQYLNQNNFEVVIFTAGTEEYASCVLDRLDPNGYISHKLYRDSCKLVNGNRYVKDLSGLGRDLKNVVIVDDRPTSYKLQPENGIPIKRFIDDVQDNELKTLMDKFFKTCEQYEDLRGALKYYRNL